MMKDIDFSQDAVLQVATTLARLDGNDSILTDEEYEKRAVAVLTSLHEIDGLSSHAVLAEAQDRELDEVWTEEDIAKIEAEAGTLWGGGVQRSAAELLEEAEIQEHEAHGRQVPPKPTKKLMPGQTWVLIKDSDENLYWKIDWKSSSSNSREVPPKPAEQLPTGQTWVLLHTEEGPRWEIRGTGALLSDETMAQIAERKRQLILESDEAQEVEIGRAVHPLSSDHTVDHVDQPSPN